MEDNEVANFIKVWTIASICLSYAYFISSKLPKGIPKLISLLPVFYLFFVTLPLSLHTIHLVSTSAFFLVWLASSNLLLFSFDLPPLSPPPQSLFRFISLACFPIKLRSTSICNQNWEKSPIIILSLAVVKFILLIVLFNIYDYRSSWLSAPSRLELCSDSSSSCSLTSRIWRPRFRNFGGGGGI
ncbi:Probable long-chain-alcohol O-fatty-acyltransferase 2 [Linum grandiflorum]